MARTLKASSLQKLYELRLAREEVGDQLKKLRRLSGARQAPFETRKVWPPWRSAAALAGFLLLRQSVERSGLIVRAPTLVRESAN